jgi:hypothetical protein
MPEFTKKDMHRMELPQWNFFVKLMYTNKKEKKDVYKNVYISFIHNNHK